MYVEEKKLLFQIYWCGNKKGHGGAGILLAEHWVSNWQSHSSPLF